jgi:DNA-binding transcriptional ArsR family regulator
MSDVKEYELLRKSPLMLGVLRLLESRDATLTEITHHLRKTKPSTSRVLHLLKQMGLIEARENPEDGRSTIFSVRKRNLVHTMLVEIASDHKPLKPFRALPFAMGDLEILIDGVLRSELTEGWTIRRTSPRQMFDFVLERQEPPLSIGLELKLGGEHFEKRVFEIIGQMLAVPNPPDLVVLAVFGAVRKKFIEIAEGRLVSLLAAQKSVARFLWLERGPYNVDRPYIVERIIKPILEWAEKIRRERR